MLETLRTTGALTGREAVFMGIVITHWDDLQVSKDFANVLLPQLLDRYGGQEFKEKIQLDNLLERVEPGASTVGARGYTKLAGEVMRIVDKGNVHEDHGTNQRATTDVRDKAEGVGDRAAHERRGGNGKV